jgi:regulator of extracellular matrix RemA (YlzA/DUF370 family)
MRTLLLTQRLKRSTPDGRRGRTIVKTTSDTVITTTTTPTMVANTFMVSAGGVGARSQPERI